MTTPPADPVRVFRDTIGRFPTGVAIVTSIGPDGPAGMTTNAVTSLSLDPLLIIVCFEARSRTLDVVRATRRFGVNVLRADDEALATVFASKRVGPEKFEALTDRRWRKEHGVPVLDRAVAWIACELRELLPGGDHEIGIGAVAGTGTGTDSDPLVFHRGRYTTTLG
ncbi:MAG TPA: flavin reductase family protein [Solirubrobacteraceae bacterium]|nr:flavin reductase family protein [Solirubrobacteraceae bacterium]